MILEAAQKNASDIHFEPGPDQLRVRFRIDGLLRDKEKIPGHLESQVISRIKILAGLDIAEKRIGQDGRINFRQNGTALDLRISSLPTIFGEKIVVRLLPQAKSFLTLEEIGLDENISALRTVAHQPAGLILITGPTGSGKTTTLYSLLKEIASGEKNTLTLEDPVEYTMGGINQVQVNNKAGLTFAGGLRWILRQDPDIIMVGEIRDPETARLAAGAALTGHLVLSTLHTSTALEAITRLSDMGLAPFLIKAAIRGIFNQRLVRRLCPDCSGRAVAGPAEKEYFNSAGLEIPRELPRPGGCAACDQTGYRGRTGIFETRLFTDKTDRQCQPVPLPESIPDSSPSLKTAGLKKVLAGTTSLEEIARVMSLN